MGTAFNKGEMGLDLTGELLGKGCFTDSAFLGDMATGFDAGLVGLCFDVGLAWGLCLEAGLAC